MSDKSINSLMSVPLTKEFFNLLETQDKGFSKCGFDVVGLYVPAGFYAKVTHAGHTYLLDPTRADPWLEIDDWVFDVLTNHLGLADYPNIKELVAAIITHSYQMLGSGLKQHYQFYFTKLDSGPVTSAFRFVCDCMMGTHTAVERTFVVEVDIPCRLFSPTLSDDKKVKQWLVNAFPCVLAFSDRYSVFGHNYIALVSCDNVAELVRVQDNLTYEYTHHDEAKTLLDCSVDSKVLFGAGATIEEATKSAMWAYLVSCLSVIYPEVYDDEMVSAYLKSFAAKLLVD